jgi:hypothetical protein
MNHKVNAVGRESALEHNLLHPDLFRASQAVSAGNKQIARVPFFDSFLLQKRNE